MLILTTEIIYAEPQFGSKLTNEYFVRLTGGKQI